MYAEGMAGVSGKRRYGILATALVWTALMVTGSSIRSIPPEVAPLFAFDKVLHFLAYAGFSWLWGAVLRAFRPEILPPRRWYLIVLLGALWGALDETYQGFFGRTRDPFDWCADVIGVSFAQAVQEIRARLKKGG